MTAFPYIEVIDEEVSLEKQVDKMVKFVIDRVLFISSDIEIISYDDDHVIYKIMHKNRYDSYRTLRSTFVNVILERKRMGFHI